MTMCAVEIRPETPDDYPAVYKVNREAFGRDNEARLVEVLRGSPGYIPALSLVAEQDGEVVGHIMFSRISIRTPDGDRTALALAPMAVEPRRQRRGIGSALVRAGLDACRQLGEPRVIVLGHPEYYPRFGFEPAARWGIQPPFEVPEDVFMACELVPGALADCAGTVEYPPEFAEE